MEKRVFDGLKEGNEVLKAIHSEMSVEAVEKLMDETQDALDHQNVSPLHCQHSLVFSLVYRQLASR